MFFLFNSVLYFPYNYHMVKEEKGDRCDLKKINYTTKLTAISFFQFQRSVLVLYTQGVSVQGVYVLGGSVLGVSVQGVYVPGGICPRG